MQRSTGNLHKLSGSAPLEQDSKGAGGGGRKKSKAEDGEKEKKAHTCLAVLIGRSRMQNGMRKCCKFLPSSDSTG